MNLHPEAQQVLELIRMAGRPPLQTLTPAEARAAYTLSTKVLQPEPQDVAVLRDLQAPGPAGEIPLRLYRAAGTDAAETLPVLIYFHGGGWVIGDLDSHDVVCRRLANESGGCVIAVDYRLAPEHAYPAAVEDTAAATAWIIGAAEALRIDPARVAVGGDSAGGNLAAVVAIMARDGALPPLGFQVLIYPSVDITATQPSYSRVVDGYPLTTGTMQWFRAHYVPEPGRYTEWRASPLRAADLAGVAPALVLTCAHDPLCDEGIAYATRLENEGVRVMHIHLSDQMHGFLTMGRLIRASGTMLATLGASLRAAWA